MAFFSDNARRQARMQAELNKFTNSESFQKKMDERKHARQHIERDLFHEQQESLKFFKDIGDEADADIIKDLDNSVWLYNQDRNWWREKHSGELERMRKKLALQENHSIAPFLAYRIADLAQPQGATIVVPHAAVRKFSEFPKIDEQLVKLYSGLNVRTFSKAFTYGKSRKTTGYDFIYQKTTPYTKGAPHESVKAVENIVAQKGRAVAFDLETFGRHGDKLYDKMQRITEFSFSDGFGDFKTGDFNIKKTYGSIIGLSGKEHKNMLNLIDRFSRGEKMAEGELVTLNRLALHGAKYTHVNWDEAKDGVVRFSSFSEQKDITGANGTIEEMIKGANLLREVGEYQEKTRVGNEMFGWEKELASAIRNIYANNLTAVSYNGNRFDIPQLDYLLHNKDLTTEAFRKEMSSILGGDHLHFNNALDAMVLPKEHMGDPYTFWSNYMGDKDKTDSLMKWMKTQKETPKTQQTILAATAIKKGLSPEAIHSGQTHIAEADAIDLMRVVFGSGFYDPNSSNSFITKKATKNAVKLKGNSTQLFFANNSTWDPHKHGVMSFAFDKDTNQWWSSDGVAIGEKGGARALYQAPGIHRRGLYELSGISKIESDSPLMPILSNHENMAGGDLFAMRWTTHTKSKLASAHRDIVLVGKYQDLMDTVNNLFTLAGAKKTGNDKEFLMENVPQEYRDMLSTVVIDAEGNRKYKTASLKDLEEISDRAFNDAAGRKARDKIASRDERLMQYVDDMDKYVNEKLKEKGLLKNQADESTIEDLRQEFRDKVKAKTKEIEEKQLSGVEVKFNEYDGSLQDYFGYIDKETGQRKAYADTMENMASLEKWARANKGLIKASLTAVRDHYGKDISLSDDRAQFFYHEIRDMFEEAAIEKVGKAGAGYQVLPRVASELNKFQVDIEGFYGVKSLSGSTMASIDINADYGVVKSLMRQMGRSANEIEHAQEDEKLTLLANFQQRLLDQGIIKLDDIADGRGQEYLVDIENDTAAIAGGKITHLMRERRKRNVWAGILSTTEQFDIIDNLVNGGLTDDEILAVSSKATGIDFQVATSFKPVAENGKPVWKKESKEGQDFLAWAKGVASDINKNIVFNNGFDVSQGTEKEEQEFIQKLVDTAGYSERDARKIYKMQRARYGASQEMLEQIIGGIYSHGGAIGYNKDYGQFWVYNTAQDVRANNYTVIGLDRNVFSNGTFKRRLANGQEFGDEVGLYYSSKHNALIYTTEEGRLARDGENLMNFMFNRGRENGNLAEEVSGIFGMRSARYRQHSADYFGDRQDRNLANVINIDETLHTIGQKDRKEIIQKLRDEGTQAADIMIEHLEKIGDEGIKHAKRVDEINSLKNASSSLAAAYMRTLHILTPYIVDSIDSGRAEFLDLFEGDTTGAFQDILSHAGDTRGQVNILSDSYRGLMSYDKDLNHISTKMDRAIPFNVERAAKIMEGRGVRFGAAFESMQEHMHMNAISEKLGHNVADTMVVNKLSADSESMRRLMRYAADKLGEDSFEYRQMMSIFTDEASGAISARAADAGLTSEHFEQHVAFGKIARSDIENSRNFEKLLKAQGKITFDADGMAHYESNAGVYVESGEELFTKASNSATYKDETVRAKQTGLLRSGIFKNGQEMTDEAVSDYINQNINKSLTGAEREQAAWALFSKENSPFSHDFYVKSLDIDGHTKLTDYSEKQMSHVLMNGLGQGSQEVDKKIASTLKELNAEKLIGRQIHVDFIQELFDTGTVKGTGFAAFVHGLTLSKAMAEKDKAKRERLLALNDAKIEEIINKNFGGVAKFASALLEERYRTNTVMDEALRDIGIKEAIDMFGHTAAGHKKHGGPSAFEATFNGLIDLKGFSIEEAKDIMEKNGAMKGIKIHEDTDGKKWAEFVTDDSHLSTKGLNKVTEKYFGGKDGWHDSMHQLSTKYGDVMYEVARTQVRVLPNYNYGKSGDRSTFKADERTIDALKSTVYTKDYIDKSSTAISDAFGDTAFSRAIQDFTKSKKDGDLAYQTLVDDFMKDTFVHEGKGVQGAEHILKNGETAQTAEEGMAWLKEQGVDKKTAQRAINALKKSNVQDATANRVLDLIEANSSTNAHEYNRSHKYSLEEMNNLGFTSLSIDDLRTNARIHKTDDKFAESLYGQAIVLDLHSNSLIDGQIYTSDRDRTIALPFSALQQEDSTGAARKSELQRQVARVTRLHDQYTSEYENHRGGGQDINEKRRSELMRETEKLRSMVAQEATDKNGTFKRASTTVISDGTMYGTAQGFQFLGDGLDGAFGNAKFLDSGKSFTELADIRNAKDAVLKGSGMDLGFLFASTQHRDAIYSDEMFEQMAGGDKKLAKQLKEKTLGVLDKEGTIAVDQRYPLVSRDPVQAVNMHFSDILGRDEFRTNLKTFRQQNGDYDSDKINAMIRKSEAEITYADGRTVRAQVDFAAYRALSAMEGTNVKLLDDNFIEAKAGMVRNAVDITPYGQPQESHWGKDGKHIADDSYGVSNLTEYTYDGDRLVNFEKKYTEEEIKTNKALLDQLNENYKTSHAEDFEKIWDAEKGAAKDEALYVQRMGNFVAQNYGKEEAAAFDEALHYRKWQMGMDERFTEAASKKAAGIMNKSLFEFSRIAHSQAKLTGKENAEVLIGLMALQEGALTGKNARGETDLKRAEELQKVWGDAVKAMYTGENREEAASALQTFVGGVFKDRAKKEFGPRSAMLGDTDELIENTTKLFGDIVRNTTIDQKEQKLLMTGISASGLKASDPLNYRSSHSVDSQLGKTAQVLNDMNAEAGVSGAFNDLDNATSTAIHKNAEDAAQQMAEAASRNRNARYRRAVVQDTAESAGKSFGRMLDIAPIGGAGGKAIAAAIGIAAGLMTAGYASGPSVEHDVPTPAQTQAMQMSNDQGDQIAMQQMSLSDSNLNVMRGGPSSGYVININAQTGQGQQAAVDAISNAASGLTPQTGSVNVNLSTSVGNSLSQLQVNRMVAHAIGVA